jgi:hypothetical protein
MDGESSQGTDEGFRGRRTWSRTCLADMAPETIAPGINRWARHDRDRRGGVRRRPEAVVRFSPNCSICPRTFREKTRGTHEENACYPRGHEGPTIDAPRGALTRRTSDAAFV